MLTTAMVVPAPRRTLAAIGRCPAPAARAAPARDRGPRRTPIASPRGLGSAHRGRRRASHDLLAILFKAGTAKSFGGEQTTVSAEVIGRDGAVIEGLYAAGEVAGMLGTEAVGHGFSGSAGACYYYGRIAGAAAAEHSR